MKRGARWSSGSIWNFLFQSFVWRALMILDSAPPVDCSAAILMLFSFWQCLNARLWSHRSVFLAATGCCLGLIYNVVGRCIAFWSWCYYDSVFCNQTRARVWIQPRCVVVAESSVLWSRMLWLIRTSPVEAVTNTLIPLKMVESWLPIAISLFNSPSGSDAVSDSLPEDVGMGTCFLASLCRRETCKMHVKHPESIIATLENDGESGSDEWGQGYRRLLEIE